MTSASGPTRPGNDAGPGPAAAPELPPAFTQDGDPYSLDELLSGLPPVPHDDALLLSELAPPPAVPPAGWMEGTSPPAEDAADVSSPVDDLRQADQGAPMDAMMDVATALPPETPVDDDVLELTDEMEDVPSADGPVDEEEDDDDEWAPTMLSMGNIVAALHALADDAPPPEDAAEEDANQDEDVLVLGDEHLVVADEPQSQEPEPLPEPEPGEDGAALAAQVEAIIAAHLPEGMLGAVKGDSTLPERLDALAMLLSDPPPAQDFAALDALYACWPRSTQDSPSRALLAVAQNLSRNFGLPGKLPMAAAKAWRMLSPAMYEAELAQRLSDIGTFIAEWQRTQRTFLILEFGEVELIEYLFEALHPGYHADLLAGVMNFKVLSNRRLGLLRRIPTRVKKQVSAMLPDGRDRALVELAHAKALLQQVADNGFAPIANAAGKALEEIEKMMKAVANIGAPPPPAAPPGGGGLPLGRIG